MKNKEFKIEPLDVQKVKDVIENYGIRHTKHKYGAIIFTGSGAGKSTTYRKQKKNNDEKFDLVDADLVYRDTEAHPLKPRTNPDDPVRPLPWWTMGDEVIQEVEKRCAVVNQLMVDNGFWVLTTSFTPEDNYVPNNIVIVLLPWEEHKKRIIEKFHSEHYDAGAEPTEEGFSIVLSHREWTKKIAREKNIPVVDSIEKAIELVKSWGCKHK